MKLNHICITNHSSRSDAEISDHAEAARLILADFCMAWGLPIPGIQFYSNNLEISSREAVVVSAVDDDGVEATAGYHTVLAGVPLFLWEVKFGAWVFFHELFEILANPLLEHWDRAPDGRIWWREVADPCQHDSFSVEFYDAGHSLRAVPCANFLYPAFFGLANHGGFSGYDRMGLVKEPFTLRPGGYAVTISPDGRREDIGAARADKGITSSRTGQLTEERVRAVAAAFGLAGGAGA